jgi:hypothetical protein
MRDERGARRRSEARNHVEHAGREARFERELAQAKRGERGLLGGLSTTVFPAASAGAIFRDAIRSGKFQGTINPTTPIGSRIV